jgi:hypothetical protein
MNEGKERLLSWRSYACQGWEKNKKSISSIKALPLYKLQSPLYN